MKFARVLAGGRKRGERNGERGRGLYGRPALLLLELLDEEREVCRSTLHVGEVKMI